MKWKLASWECYEDPESLNLFYTLKPKAGDIENDRYSCYQWFTIPQPVKGKYEWTQALKYLRLIRCEKMRIFGRCTHYRCQTTNLNFYFDEARANATTKGIHMGRSYGPFEGREQVRLCE